MKTQVYEFCSLNPWLWAPLRNSNYQVSPCKFMEYILKGSGLWSSSSWNTLTQFASSHSDFLRCISASTSYLGAGLVNSFLQIFQPKPSMYLYILSRMPYVWNWIFRIILNKKCKSWTYVFCSFLRYHFTYSFFWPNIFFHTVKTLSNIRWSFMFSQNSRRKLVVAFHKIAKSDY